MGKYKLCFYLHWVGGFTLSGAGQNQPLKEIKKIWIFSHVVCGPEWMSNVVVFISVKTNKLYNSHYRILTDDQGWFTTMFWNSFYFLFPYWCFFATLNKREMIVVQHIRNRKRFRAGEVMVICKTESLRRKLALKLVLLEKMDS